MERSYFLWLDILFYILLHTLSAGAVEYTDCISATGLDSHPKLCPRYNTKSFNGEASALEL